ncbi:MAG: hypothetical protein PHX27_03990, partial [Candidatus ainarchaeum sp.]|nr:hypothetical protein [Candidatus ainarchaeum sp.]
TPVAFNEESSITIDTTNCLNQKIDIWLCKGNTGCSGGAPEGKISLGKNNFMLQNDTQTITATASDLPGSYGIDVWARVHGKSSFTFIGDGVVAFKEPEGKFFELNKYELNLIGQGMQDTILLTNKMLDQKVKVRATNAVWGKQKPKINWLQVIGGAAIGAGLGNMIGSGFSMGETNEDKTQKPTNTNETETNEDNSQNPTNTPPNNLSDSELTSVTTQVEQLPPTDPTKPDNVTALTIYRNDKTGDLQTNTDGKNVSGWSDYGQIVKTSSEGPDGTEYSIYTYSGLGKNKVFNSAADATTYATNIIGNSTSLQRTAYSFGSGAQNLTIATADLTGDLVKFTAWTVPKEIVGATWDATKWTASQTWDATKWTVATTYDAASWGLGTVGDGLSWGIDKAGDGLSGGYNWVANNTWRPTTQPTTPTDITPNPNAGNIIITRNQSPAKEIFKVRTNNLSQLNLPSLQWDFEKEFNLWNNNKTLASFEPANQRTYAGWGSAIGAILGGLAGWYMQDQAAKDYLKEFNTASYRDFVIFLQGDNISVSSPDGKTIEEKNIPGDAGALGFSLNEIGVNWDFTNADYSTIENVGLQFSNNGLNEARAKYGTLTINATQNKHGSAIVGNDITSETEYDVTCNKPTFGNYWIGSEEDSGLCTGVSKTNYSQKYHLRVISGEPTGEEASISSSKTCNNGVLTGNTGIEAIPRIKLDWSWNNINENMCDYGNADYAYCDGVQNIVTLVKKLAALQEFFKLNNNTGCPEDPILNDYLSEFDEINSMVELVSEGRIGIEDIIVSVIEDEAIATVKVNNKTGGDIESYVSVVWKGQDEPQNTLKTQTFAPGITELEFTATVDKIDDAYFFTAIANGPSGNNRAVTRAFVNLPPNMGCWAQPTTRIVGGIPSIMYYLANQDTIQWTSKIPDTRTLYEYINFGSYLIRENYSKELFKDTGEYYLNTVFEMTDDTEKAILTKIMNGEIDVVKRFSTQASFEAGLYDAWMNIDFGGDFDLLSDETNIEVSLLMIRSPSEMNPLYKMPFNGLIGENNRANYGTVYTNMSDEELKITNNITTKYNSTGNGIINVKTKKEYDFEKLNSSIGTRGQLAIISNNGSEAEITFTPNYATPVIGKYDLSGTNGQFTFEVERNFSPLTTGGNINFWTGAAKSKNFYGGSAIET